MRRCEKCKRELMENEFAAYGFICEDCFAKRRTHKKHYKTGGRKTHSTSKKRGHGLKVKEVF